MKLTNIAVLFAAVTVSSFVPALAQSNYSCSGSKYTADGATCYLVDQYMGSSGQCLWKITSAVAATNCAYLYAGPQPGDYDGQIRNNPYNSCAGFEYRFENETCNRYESLYSPTYGRCYFEFSGSTDEVNCGRTSSPIEQPAPPQTSLPSPGDTDPQQPSMPPLPNPEVVEVVANQKATFQLDDTDPVSNRRCEVQKGAHLKVKIFYSVGELNRVKLFSDIANCAIGKSGTSGFLTRANFSIL